MSHNSLIDHKLIINKEEIREELLIPNTLYVDAGLMPVVSFKMHRCIETMDLLKKMSKKKNKIKITCKESKCDTKHDLFNFDDLILQNKIFDFKKVMVECVFMEKQ